MRTTSFLEARLDAALVAFPLQEVERVVRAVALHTVPGTAGCLLGAMDLAGELVSVYDTRRLLGVESRRLRASDRIVLTRQPTRCGLVVDEVLGTSQVDTLELADSFSLAAAGVRGVVRGNSGVLLVQDLRRLLALERAIPIASHA